MATEQLSTRRALLKMGTAVASFAGIPALAQGATFTDPDAALSKAWDRRQRAYAVYNAIPPNDTLDGPSMTPEEIRLWEIIDTAEEVIQSTTARTPHGASIQLWCALHYSILRREDDDAVTRGDLAAIDRHDSELDWNARLVLAALRSLQTMGGR